jgi:hypothetical protein
MFQVAEQDWLRGQPELKEAKVLSTGVRQDGMPHFG